MALTLAFSALLMFSVGCGVEGGGDVLTRMREADSTARAMGLRGEHAARLPVLERALAGYAEEFERGAHPAADSLAFVLWDRLAVSRHALGDTLGWAEAAGAQMGLLFAARSDSARHDEARRLAYAVGFGDYAEGVRALRTLEDGALLRRDFDMAALARHCLDHLIRAHPGIPVPIALGDADASACEPTDARLLVALGLVLLLTLVIVLAAHGVARESGIGRGAPRQAPRASTSGPAGRG